MLLLQKFQDLQINHIFFFVKLISVIILPVSYKFETRREGISSLIQSIIQSLFEHPSSLYGFKNPSSKNFAESNKLLSLVSDISRISRLAQTSFKKLRFNPDRIHVQLSYDGMVKIFCLGSFRLQHLSSLSIFPSQELVI